MWRPNPAQIQNLGQIGWLVCGKWTENRFLKNVNISHFSKNYLLCKYPTDLAQILHTSLVWVRAKGDEFSTQSDDFRDVTGARDNVNIASVSCGTAFPSGPWGLLTMRTQCQNWWGHGTLKVPGPLLVWSQWLFYELPIVGNVCQYKILARVDTQGPGFLQQTQPLLQHLYPLTWCDNVTLC